MHQHYFDNSIYREEQPLNENMEDIEKQAIRRVEVAIYANKKMKRLAKKRRIRSWGLMKLGLSK